MNWIVALHIEFDSEFEAFSIEVQDHIYAKMQLLEEHGSNLGRPYVDTLNGSMYSNMKELRFSADNGVWRVALAFDTERHCILLVGADKKGKDQKRFYKRLIKTADKRFSSHLENLK